MIERLTRQEWTLETLGWSDFFAQQLQPKERARFTPARIVEAYRKRFLVHTGKEVFWSLARGSMFHRANSPLELPAVGDWVLVERIPNQEHARLWRLLDRRTALVRQAAGERTQAQVIAANLDHIFIVTSMNQEFNARRLERYMALATDSGARVSVILNKSDLVDGYASRDAFIARAREAAPGAEHILTMSMVTRQGAAALLDHVQPSETIGFIGSSGVGKSTIVNLLYGDEDLQATGSIRELDDKGRHTTTARQLILLDTGALLLDTPGMRELGLWQIDERDMEAFSDIIELAATCKFRDCKHGQETGCAVQQAIEEGSLDAARVASWQKLDHELAIQRERQREAERKLAKKRPNAKKRRS